MKPIQRSSTPPLAPVVALLMLFAPPAIALDWTPYSEVSTIEIITTDADGTTRETKIWIVVIDGAGFIRTNDSRWLANIRRDSSVRLRTRGSEVAVVAAIVESSDLYDQVEEAFKVKYGVMQRVMSAFRASRPTVMRLEAGQGN